MIVIALQPENNFFAPAFSVTMHLYICFRIVKGCMNPHKQELTKPNEPQIMPLHKNQNPV